VSALTNLSLNSPISKDLKNGVIQEGNKDYAGELSVTLVDA
jgi:hypothetical protein